MWLLLFITIARVKNVTKVAVLKKNFFFFTVNGIRVIKFFTRKKLLEALKSTFNFNKIIEIDIIYIN
jgi:hypothetical protein